MNGYLDVGTELHARYLELRKVNDWEAVIAFLKQDSFSDVTHFQLQIDLADAYYNQGNRYQAAICVKQAHAEAPHEEIVQKWVARMRGKPILAAANVGLVLLGIFVVILSFFSGGTIVRIMGLISFAFATWMGMSNSGSAVPWQRIVARITIAVFILVAAVPPLFHAGGSRCRGSEFRLRFQTRGAD